MSGNPADNRPPSGRNFQCGHVEDRRSGRCRGKNERLLTRRYRKRAMLLKRAIGAQAWVSIARSEGSHGAVMPAVPQAAGGQVRLRSGREYRRDQ